MSAGKGDAPRSVNLKRYRENYEAINWRRGASRTGGDRQSDTDFMRSRGFLVDHMSEREASLLRRLMDY